MKRYYLYLPFSLGSNGVERGLYLSVEREAFSTQHVLVGKVSGSDAFFDFSSGGGCVMLPAVKVPRCLTVARGAVPYYRGGTYAHGHFREVTNGGPTTQSLVGGGRGLQGYLNARRARAGAPWPYMALGKLPEEVWERDWAVPQVRNRGCWLLSYLIETRPVECGSKSSFSLISDQKTTKIIRSKIGRERQHLYFGHEKGHYAGQVNRERPSISRSKGGDQANFNINFEVAHIDS